MSRQFNNDFEILLFNQIEFNQRKEYFMELGKLFWRKFSMTDARKNYFEDCFRDEAGPIIDGMILYSAFCSYDPNPENPLALPFGVFTSVWDLPREYLVTLCLSIGVCQQWPGWLSKWVVAFTPSMMLRRQIQRISAIVCHDDALLLEEGHDLNGCESLTDQEIDDACLMRGLPVLMDDRMEMRRLLTNHLKMISNVKRHMNEAIHEGFQMFTIQLNPLRYHLKMVNEKSPVRSRST
jgi:hypothetical protein